MNTKFYLPGYSYFISLTIRLLVTAIACFPVFAFGNTSLTLTCPGDLTVQAGPGECSIPVSFDDLFWTSTVPLMDTVFLPASGSLFETGTTQVLLGTTDINGNNAVCIFYVTILPFNGNAVSCLASVEVTLNGLCQRQLTAAELLPTGSFGCGGNFSINRLNPNGSESPGFITANDFAAPVPFLIKNTLTNAQCTTQVVLIGSTPPSITCPPNIIIICNEPLDSSNTGAPAHTGCYQDLGIVWYDVEVGINCPDTFGFQITRHWVATDPFGKKDTCLQLITGKRFELDEVVFPPDFDGTEQPVLSCSPDESPETLTHPDQTGTPTVANYPPDAHFHCRMAMTYTDFVTEQCGVGREIKRVWKVVKLCLPSVTVLDTQTIVLVDVLPPVFEVPDTIFISLSNSCADSLDMPPATGIVECSAYSVEIRTPWDTLHTNGGITRINLAAGSYPVQYILKDSCGNAAIKNSLFFIENKVLRSCPPDVTVSCEYYFDSIQVLLTAGTLESLPALGNPVFYANCSLSTDETNSGTVNTCGIGTVERNIFTTNTTPIILCQQTITVEHLSDFEVQFPVDTSLCAAPTTQAAGVPELFNINCEEVAVTFTDSVASSIPGTCYTVWRTWTAANECYANPGLNLPDPEVASRRFQDGGDGYIVYRQVIEVNDNAIPTFPNGCEISDKIAGVDCTVDFTLPVPVVLGCGNVILTVNGSLGTVLDSTHQLPAGTYNVTYKALGECGTMGTCMTEFSVMDTTPPVAVCKNWLVVELMNVDPPMVQVWATDFNNGSADACPGILKYSYSENVMDIGMLFDCCDVGQEDIELWVTDAAGNQNHCETFIIIQSNCDPNDPSIMGNISTEDDEGINHVEVIFTVPNAPTESTFTSTSGEYWYYGAYSGLEYPITPFKDTLPLNGVSTFDAVLIRKHILDLAPLNSPYKIIAADINKSNSITTLDLVFLQKLILGIDTTLPNGNTSWRFVDKDYVFPDPTNPFQEVFPESIFSMGSNECNPLPPPNFIGIKVGDVNGNASTNFLPRRKEDED